MNQREEEFAIIALKTNNDIARVIMKHCAPSMQMLFERIIGIDHIPIVELIEDINKNEELAKDLFDHLIIPEIWNIPHMQKPELLVLKYERWAPRIAYHFVQFIRNFVIKNKRDDIYNTIFVIRNNKIVLKKGDIFAMDMCEIVDFTGKIVTEYRSVWRHIEKGNLMINSFNYWDIAFIYALGDTVVIFDYYIAPRLVRACRKDNRCIYHNDFVTGKELSPEERKQIPRDIYTTHRIQIYSPNKMNEYFDQKFSFAQIV